MTGPFFPVECVLSNLQRSGQVKRKSRRLAGPPPRQISLRIVHFSITGKTVMFNKLKQAFGVGTIKVELDIPPAADKSGTSLSSTVRLTAESDQLVEGITFRFIEKYSTGRGSEKKTTEFDIGK